jgi:8-amino-7-oxononanoate synthase
MDIFSKCGAYTEAKEVMATGLYPYFIPLEKNEGTEAIIEGHRLIMCGSNNYLGLTTHPKVRQAAIEAIQKYGTSCTGSRFLNGTLEMHERLERELSEWVGKDAALVFSTGMQTNLGVVSSLIGRMDIAVMDKGDHASIVDGARLSYGSIERFQHNDPKHLERVLASIPEDRGKLVIVDGLYSMEGDIADLPMIIPLCKKYGARLMVDDAHAMGVLGGGRGTAAQFGMTKEVDLIMSTFSKSFASLGGFIAGDEDVIHFIKHNARALIFSASMPPAATAAALAALDVMRNEPERVENLQRNAAMMHKGFKELGFDTGHSVTPIIPIIIGDNQRTLMTWKKLFEAGVFVNPVLAPATPPGRQLLRTSYMATHTEDQLNRVLEIFARVGREMGLIP